MLKPDFSKFPLLTTGQLVLRQLQLTDRHNLQLLRSDEKVNEYLDRPGSCTEAESIQFIEKINKSIAENQSLYWAITQKDVDELIGTICMWNFDKENHIAEIGYELMPRWQKKGFMQEAVSKVIEYAFRELKLERLEAYTHPSNNRSNLLLEKFHFIKKDETAETGELIFFLENPH